MAELNYAQVSRLLKPDFESGTLYWLYRTPDMFNNNRSDAECSRWNSRYGGRPALTCIDRFGYANGRILNKQYAAHRVIWLLYTGEWPCSDIDHINGRRSDNRILNLRDVSASENGKNRRMSKNNTSGTQGVHWNKKRCKWAVMIRDRGCLQHIGYFSDVSAAIQARKAAELERGFHPNHGRH